MNAHGFLSTSFPRSLIRRGQRKCLKKTPSRWVSKLLLSGGKEFFSLKIFFLQQSRPKKADISSLYFSNIAEDSETSFAFCTKVDLANASARKGIETFILNLSSESTNIVLFKDSIEHILRICRVLQSCKGSIMLVGLGGSGKQSLARVAARWMGRNSTRQTKEIHIPAPAFLKIWNLHSEFPELKISQLASC